MLERALIKQYLAALAATRSGGGTFVVEAVELLHDLSDPAVKVEDTLRVIHEAPRTPFESYLKVQVTSKRR